MSSSLSESMYQEPRYSQRELERGHESGPLSFSLLLAALVVAGAAALAWYYLGPDLVRYMKIRSM